MCATWDLLNKCPGEIKITLWWVSQYCRHRMKGYAIRLANSREQILHTDVSHIIFKRCKCLNVTLRQDLHSAMLLDIRFHIMRKGIQMNSESNSLICLVLRQGGGECASGEAESELTFFLECWQLLPFEKQQGNWRCWERFKRVCITTTLVRRPGPTKIKQD